MREATHPWWVIGSAAVVLHGAATPVGDIDLLLDEADATPLAMRLDLAARPGVPDATFRSSVFFRWTGAALPVEFMAGLTVQERGAWRPVALKTCEWVPIGAETIAVPARDELRTLLRRFGRAKDLARAALLAPANASAT